MYESKNARKIMNQERWQKMGETFNKNLILPVEQRTLPIDRRWAGDIELGDEINELVSEAESAGKLSSDLIFTLCRRLIKTALKLDSVILDENNRPF